MINKEQIKALMTNYQAEYDDICRERSSYDENYIAGYHIGKQGVLWFVIKDLEKLLNE